MKIGAQLYTVRNFCKTPDDFSNTLTRIAEIGYTTVQVSGTCEYTPEWLAAELKRTGLKCVITHISPDRLLGETQTVCDDHRIFDCKNIGIGAMPKGEILEQRYADFVKNFTPIAEKIKANGQKLFYHNHAFEFERGADGRIFMDRFLDDFNPDTLGITFDTYWAQFGGADPAEYLRKLKGRVECIHLKDLTVVANEQRMAPVGHGNMNFPRIIESAEYAGVEYLLVEQDNSYGDDPFKCLTKSYDYLTSLGLS